MISSIILWIVKRIDFYFFEEDWNIGIVDKPIESVLTDKHFFNSINWFPKGENYFLADPFYLEDSNSIFCEYYNYTERIGRIVEIKDFQSESSIIPTSIESDFHISYPHIFNLDGQTFCIPESSAEHCTKLYKYINGAFELINSTLNELDTVDSTFVQFQGSNYLFYSRASEAFGNENLYIGILNEFSSIDSHPQNPVKSNVASCRSAGSFFDIDGKLYRPAQNCSKTYGGSIVINQVQELSAEKYSESSVLEIKPSLLGTKFTGVHTINRAGSQTLIDAKVKKFAPFKMLQRRSSSVK